MSSAKVVFLLSSDGETFEVDEAVILVSETIKNMIEDGCVNGVIPLPNVSSKILPKVIEYCKKQVTDNGSSSSSSSSKKKKTTINGDGDGDGKGKGKGKEAILADVVDDDDEKRKAKADEEPMKKWKAEYMDIDQDVLYDLMLAANYLHIDGLLDLTTEKAISMIKGKTPEQIRKVFNIKNDFTPEEEQEIQKENAWAFQ